MDFDVLKIVFSFYAICILVVGGLIGAAVTAFISWVF